MRMISFDDVLDSYNTDLLFFLRDFGKGIFKIRLRIHVFNKTFSDQFQATPRTCFDFHVERETEKTNPGVSAIAQKG